MKIENNNFILSVDSLSVNRIGQHSTQNFEIIKNVAFNIKKGEFFTIIGENGSGKSTLALAITNLLPKNLFIIKGNITFDGDDVLELTQKKLTELRKEKIGYIFQNPFNSFDPIKNIEFHFIEVLSSSWEYSDLKNHFERLRLPNYEEIKKKYPHQLSGGMLQRISAIRAIIKKPTLLIADEPTSALDRPMINLFFDYLTENININKTTTILITQDLGVAKEFSDKIGIFKEGILVDIMNREDFSVTGSSLHTKHLLDAYYQTYGEFKTE